MVSLGGMGIPVRMGNKDLLAPLDLLDPLAPRVGGPCMSDGERALVHRQQALRWSTLASQEEITLMYKEVDPTTSACPRSQSTVPPSHTEEHQMDTPGFMVLSMKDHCKELMTMACHVQCAT